MPAIYWLSSRKYSTTTNGPRIATVLPAIDPSRRGPGRLDLPAVHGDERAVGAVVLPMQSVNSADRDVRGRPMITLHEFDRVESVRMADESRSFLALEEAGYKASWCRRLGLEYQVLLQKRVRGRDGGTLYFVNVWAYDWRKYRPQYDGPPVSFAPEVQFNAGRDDDGPPIFNVSLLLPNRGDLIDVPAMERFFADIYERMGCVPYEAVDQ